MFGWGVKDDQTYLARLQRILDSAYPDVSWEVVNTAVPGYDTVMDIEALKEKGLGLYPDLVLIHLVDNGLSLPNYIREESNLFEIDRC